MGPVLSAAFKDLGSSDSSQGNAKVVPTPRSMARRATVGLEFICLLSNWFKEQMSQ